MNPLMRDFVEPTTDMRVGGGHIQGQAHALERGGQRRDETALEVYDADNLVKQHAPFWASLAPPSMEAFRGSK